MTPQLRSDLLASLGERDLPLTTLGGPAGTEIDVERATRVQVRAHRTILRAILIDGGRPAPEVVALQGEVWWLWVALGVTLGGLLGMSVLVALGAVALWVCW